MVIDKKERQIFFNDIIEKAKNLGIKQTDIAEILGISKYYVSDIKAGRAPLQNEHIVILEEKFNVKYDKNRNSSNKYDKPFYDKQVNGSNDIEVFNDTYEEPAYFMRLPNFPDADFIVPFYGDSMFPNICSGEMIVCKESSKEIIMYGEVYYVLYNDIGKTYRTVKKVFKDKSNPANIVLQPANPSFHETSIPLDKVSKMYIVQGQFKRRGM